MDVVGETTWLTQSVTNLVINCPMFLALLVGLVVGVMALARGNRAAGALALAGFAILGVLLLLSTFLGGGQMAALAYDEGMEPGRIGLIMVGVGCVRSLVEMVGLLCIVGSIAVYVLRPRE
ncbi:MAG: hypothetical protein KKA73_25255 [Chloroflexi bacterium]|nr:hypothetical protein [Chloroflexota bacterium]